MTGKKKKKKKNLPKLLSEILGNIYTVLIKHSYTFKAQAWPPEVHGAPPSSPIIHALSALGSLLESLVWAMRLSISWYFIASVT